MYLVFVVIIFLDLFGFLTLIEHLQSIYQDHTQLHFIYEQECSIHDTTQSHLQRESHVHQELKEIPKTLHHLHTDEVATHEKTQGQYASILSDHTKLITTLNEA